jgi:hypothetical protein
MFDPKRATQEPLLNYIGGRVTDAEETWIRDEMKRRGLNMSDLIRLALKQLRARSPR